MKTLVIHSKRFPSVYTLMVLFYLMTTGLKAQEGIRFHAFGETPLLINDSLYKALSRTKDTRTKLNLLYTIGNQHALYGIGDSTVYYANLMNRENLTHNQANYDFTKKAQLLLGKGKYISGLYDGALKAFVEGLEYENNPKDSLTDYQIKLELGRVYQQKKAFDKSEILLKEIADSGISKELSFLANMSLGAGAMLQDSLNISNTYLDKAEKLADMLPFSKNNLRLEYYKGYLAFEQKNYQKATTLFQKVMHTSFEKNYYDLYTNAIVAYGEILISQDEFDAANMSLSIAYTNAMQWGRLDLQKKIINSLRRLHQAKGDYKNAYNLMTQYLGVSNEITKKQNSEAIQELEFKYQTLQKENQIFELKETQLAKQNEIDRQKTIKKAFLYGFIVVLIPIVALLWVYYQKLQTQSQLNVQQKEISTQKMTSVLREQELNLAKTALNAQQEERYRIAQQLHDSIGGNLAGIKLQMANTKDAQKTQNGILEQIDETYEMVRDISHNLVPQKFNQNAFSALVEAYINNLKNGSPIEVNFLAHPKAEIDKLPDTFKVEIYQVIQELFANTIKHAKAKSIELHLTIYESVLQLLFEDNGVGFDSKTVKNGLGLYNIKNRLEQLNAKMTMDSTPGRGTVVTIEIPLNPTHENI